MVSANEIYSDNHSVTLLENIFILDTHFLVKHVMAEQTEWPKRINARVFLSITVNIIGKVCINRNTWTMTVWIIHEGLKNNKGRDKVFDQNSKSFFYKNVVQIIRLNFFINVTVLVCYHGCMLSLYFMCAREAT